MTDSDLTFFGEPFTVTEMPHANRTVYTATYGLFHATIIRHNDDAVVWGMNLAWVPTPSGVSCVYADTVTEARDLAEAEATRIAREMLEIAGPLEASSCELLEPAMVRFRDE